MGRIWKNKKNHEDYLQFLNHPFQPTGEMYIFLYSQNNPKNVL